MYCSLNLIDVICKRPQGGELYIQTDHRSPAEITAEKDLSIIYAVLRIQTPRWVAEAQGMPCAVEYHIQQMPPLFLQQAISAAQGTLHVGDAGATQQVELKAVALEPLLNQAFSQLAHRVCANAGLPLALSSLQRIESTVAALRQEDDSEITYWKSLVSLAAVAGEVIRLHKQGHWMEGASVQTGSFPLRFVTNRRGNPADVNLLGKAKKFLDQGEDDAPSGLVQYMLSP